MTERPIIMTGESVHAIMCGRKTQTRRVIKPQPVHEDEPWPNNKSCATWGDVLDHQDYYMGCGYCPYGKPGDRLWVRETWRPAASIDGPNFDAKFNYGRNSLYYRADQADVYAATDWRPSIFMPRWASRLTLEIVSVKVERVNQISEIDAIAEGAPIECNYMGRCNSSRCEVEHYRKGFRKLWESINGKRLGCSWSDNPFTWAITLKRVK